MDVTPVALPDMRDADPADAPPPESVVRLASAVHRFAVPRISPKDDVSFSDSFRSCAAGNRSTVTAIRAADDRRKDIRGCMADEEHVNHASLSEALGDYIPLINQILLSCKFRPEAARLDCKTLFSWTSGIERSGEDPQKHHDSEALMFELVLAVSALALSESNLGCDARDAGDFPGASRRFAKSAGVFQFLGEDLLPEWLANANDRQRADMARTMPAETSAGTACAFAALHRGAAQQMAIATVLSKPDAPNYALVGKLCLGAAEELESSAATLRSAAAVQTERMDPSFHTLTEFSASVHRALGQYFLARSLWRAGDYGVAIAALREAMTASRTRTSRFGRGLPQVMDPTEPMQSGIFIGRGLLPVAEPGGQLEGLLRDVEGFREHMVTLLEAWERENSVIYFVDVPASVPADKALKAILLKKSEGFVLEERDPLPLEAPTKANKAKPKGFGLRNMLGLRCS